MKRLRHRFFGFVALIVALLIGYRGLGGFADLAVIEQEMSGYTVAYVAFTGSMFAYHPHVDKVEEMLESKGIRELGKLSIYHDLYTDKRSKDSEDDGGVIVDPQDVAKLDKDATGYKIMTIPAGKKMVVKFPYKAPFSCMVGHIRGTKQMYEYLKANGDEYATVIEIYDEKNDVIQYIAELPK